MNPENTLSKERIKIITWVLLLIMPIVGMSVDLIAPSLPAIARNLDVTNHAVKNTISLYLLGYGLGNFITGFLTDAYGRKRLFRFSLLAFALISILPNIFPNIEVLLVARLLQGITMGAVAVLIRAILSDIHTSEELINLGILLGTMWGLGPVLGPILGGYFQSAFGWKAGFYFFSIVTVIFFCVILPLLPETHVNRKAWKVEHIKGNMKELLNNQLFLSLSILMGLAYSLLIVFNTMAPFLIQEVFQYSPVFFGHVAFYLGCIFLVSTLTCRYLLARIKIRKLYFFLINTALLLSIIFLLITLAYSHSLMIVIIASALMFFSTGFLFPMSMGKGMSLFKHIAGTASATMYLINILMTSLISMIVSFIPIHSFTPIMSVYVLLIAGCAMIYWKVLCKNSQLS